MYQIFYIRFEIYCIIESIFYFIEISKNTFTTLKLNNKIYGI